MVYERGTDFLFIVFGNALSSSYDNYYKLFEFCTWYYGYSAGAKISSSSVPAATCVIVETLLKNSPE